MNHPQLIIPMSGLGKRFLAAGYQLPKPLIPILGRPIISHILEMYPGWEEVIFVVNENHLLERSLHLEEILLRECPTGQIRAIKSHDLGPSSAIFQAQDLIDRERPIVVNYCDFAGTFNLMEFERHLNLYDSTVLTYTGFHPHMLRSTKFAYVKKSDTNEVTGIQEKSSYTGSPMSEEASAGAYGFGSGEILLSSIEKQMEENYSLNGEYYTSLTVKAVLANGGRVSSLLMDRFFQWGTPEDLEDFNYWANCLSHMDEKNPPQNKNASQTTIVLAAGKGARVASHASVPKPILSVGNKKLWEMAARAGGVENKTLIVLRDELLPYFEEKSNLEFVVLDKLTRGQADSARFGLERIAPEENMFTSILASDNVLPENFCDIAVQGIIENGFDIVVWTARNYPSANLAPTHFSWVNVESSLIRDTLYKSAPPIDDPSWQVITGNFTFKTNGQALRLVKELLEDESKMINEEFYLDSIIAIGQKRGLKIGALEIPWYFSLGTVEELKTFHYWSDVFKN